MKKSNQAIRGIAKSRRKWCESQRD